MTYPVPYSESVISCKVKALVSETYGKMPVSMAENQIIMELDYMTENLVEQSTYWYY